MSPHYHTNLYYSFTHLVKSALKYDFGYIALFLMVFGCKWSVLVQKRHKVTVNSFKQWKDLLVFKRHDGKHVWNLPKFIPHEFGFRRIARKPPFFKLRKFTFPKIETNPEFGSNVLYNRSVYIKYGWEKKSREFYNIKDYVDKYYKGVKVVGVPSSDDVLQVLDENEDVLMDLKSPKDLNRLFKS